MKWDAGHDFGIRDGWAGKKIFDRAANVADKLFKLNSYH